MQLRAPLRRVPACKMGLPCEIDHTCTSVLTSYAFVSMLSRSTPPTDKRPSIWCKAVQHLSNQQHANLKYFATFMCMRMRTYCAIMVL